MCMATPEVNEEISCFVMLHTPMAQSQTLYPFLCISLTHSLILELLSTLCNMPRPQHTHCRYITHVYIQDISHSLHHTLISLLSHLIPGHRWFCLQANLNENESLSDFSRKRSNPRRLLRGPGPLFGITAA